MCRSGFLTFHISTSLSTMSLLPPLRSHITRSADDDVVAAKLDASRPKASAPKAFDNLMMFLPFLPASAQARSRSRVSENVFLIRRRKRRRKSFASKFRHALLPVTREVAVMEVAFRKTFSQP